MSAALSRRCGPVVSGPAQQRRNPRRGEARELPAPTGSALCMGTGVPGSLLTAAFAAKGCLSGSRPILTGL